MVLPQAQRVVKTRSFWRLQLAQSIKAWAEKLAELERGELGEDAYADRKASF